MHYKSKQSYQTASPRVLWFLCLPLSSVFDLSFSCQFISHHRSLTKTNKVPLADNLLSTVPLFSATLILQTEMKWQSFLGQWHVLAVIQTAAAEERYIQYVASIKKLRALLIAPPFMRWMRETGEADWGGKEAESVMLRVHSSLCEYARESERVS